MLYTIVILLTLGVLVLSGISLALYESLRYLESRVLMLSGNKITVQEFLQEAERILEERDYD